MGLLAVIWLLDGRVVGVVLALLGLASGALLTLDAARSRVETSAEGMRVVRAFSTTWIPWQAVGQVRPDAAGPWGTKLVVERGDGSVERLPLSPASEEVLERWKRTAERESG
jgi:hypothetical protein